MRILIPGGLGYLGGRVAQFLASRAGSEILLGTRGQTESPTWLREARVVQIRWDSPADLEKICFGVDAIVHLAGMNAQDCAANSVAALAYNALGAAHLLQAALRQGVKRFIYLSTAHVYGSPLVGKITEETLPTSLHPYATSHRAGGDVIRFAHQRQEIAGIEIRLSNAFGAPTHKAANCWMLLVNDLCRQAATTQKMVLQSSGLQRRDFITLTDSCRAIGHLLELSADKLGDGLFNVGGAWSPTVWEMTQRIAERFQIITGKRPEISRLTDPGSETSQPLDYEIRKLLDTGFRLSAPEIVDQEIDGLIQFCLANFGVSR